MKKLTIKKGETYNRLTIIKEIEPSFSSGRAIRHFRCKCVCGNKVNARLHDLRNGKIQSCKCLLKERLKKGKHGHANTGKLSPTYRSWTAMKTRCNNPKQDRWDRYGGRGITYCKRWEKFENFLADMGQRPKKRTLDRINNNGNYSKKNCRWATNKEQRANR